MICYPIILAKDDNGTYLATSKDFPELTTFGEDQMDALARAEGALLEAIEARIADREDVPVPNRNAKICVQLPMLASMKVAIYSLMREQNLRKSDLVRLLRTHPVQVDRLLNLNHATPLKKLEDAFSALDKDVEFKIVDRQESRAG